MKIVLLDAYAANPGDLSWDGLREFGEVTVYDRTAPKDVLARIGDAEVVYVNKVRLDEQTLRQCENLKLVSVLATGYNVVDTAAAKEGSYGTFMAASHASNRPMSPWAASPVEIWKQS